jgi:hypothetical protein
MGRTKPTDYSKLVIYKIKCNDELILDFYVGSTTCFKSRKNQHKIKVENGNKFKIYETIRANGGWENWSMIEIEIYPCNSSTEARIREEYWRVELQATLNMIKAYCTEEEKKATHLQYIQKHSEEIKIQSKKYYQKHANKIKEYTKKYREEHKEEIKIKESEYREEHKEEIKIKNSKYRQNNGDKLKEKFECKCGGKYTHTNKSRHELSQKHQKFVISFL